jgi:hypothetical protein
MTDVLRPREPLMDKFIKCFPSTERDHERNAEHRDAAI